MKHVFLFTLLMVSFSFLSAQNYRFVYVTVSDLTEKDLQEVTSSVVRKRIEQRLERIKHDKYELLVSGNKARFSFYKTDILPENYRIPTKKFYYFDNKTIEDVTFTDPYKHFYVERPLNFYPWVITEETAVINGYTCYYAYADMSYDDFRGQGEYTMEAWFCPDFPMQYGPNEYFGLPGVVFVANQKGERYRTVLREIQILDQELDLEIPTIKKTISDKQYTAEFNKMMEDGVKKRGL